MSDKWNCPDCGAKNPSGRVQCYKRGCYGMPERELRKLIAFLGSQDML